jgi:hypothetical protein
MKRDRHCSDDDITELVKLETPYKKQRYNFSEMLTEIDDIIDLDKKHDLAKQARQARQSRIKQLVINDLRILYNINAIKGNKKNKTNTDNKNIKDI